MTKYHRAFKRGCPAMPPTLMQTPRRTFLTSAAAGALLVGCSGAGRSSAAKNPGDRPKEEDELTPAEDLMREPGVLRRVRYRYDEAAVVFDGKRDAPLHADGRLVVEIH